MPPEATTETPAAPAETSSLLGAQPPAAGAEGATPPADGATGATGEAPKEPDTNSVTKDNPFKVDEIKFADGTAVQPEMGQAFADVVNEFGIPRNAVAKLLDLQQKTMLANSEAGSRDWAKTQEEWTAEVMKDAEIGGSNWPKVQTQIGGLIDKYGSPELRQAFDLTGAGNNPHIVRFMSKVASVLSESGFISSNQSGSAEKTAAELLYPNQGKQ